MTNKHEKHFSTVANSGDSDDEKDERQTRRCSIVSDAGLWSDCSVDGGSERDELEDITTEFHDPPIIESSPSHATRVVESPEIAYSTPMPLLSNTPLCDSLLEWFDEQIQEFGFEDMRRSRSKFIKILPTEEDWSQLIKLSTGEKIVYLLRKFCPESCRASWFRSKESLFFARLTPEEMIRYLYLSPVDRDTLSEAYFETLGPTQLVSEERKKSLTRFVFEGETVNLI